MAISKFDVIDKLSINQIKSVLNNWKPISKGKIKQCTYMYTDKKYMY